MITYTKEQLKNILDQHKLWLQNSSKGKRAILSNADLYNANLKNANLSYAILINANLSYAILSNAILSNAILSDASLNFTNIDEIWENRYRITPEFDSFYLYKKCFNFCIVKLLVPKNTPRSLGINRKIRVKRAKVINIYPFNSSDIIKSTFSLYDSEVIYTVGEYVSVKDYDLNPWVTCSTGIHGYLTKQEAEDHVC